MKSLKHFLSGFCVVSFAMLLWSASYGQSYPNNMTQEEYMQLKADVAAGLIEEPVLYENTSNGSRQGGDTQGSAVVIPALPYIDSGTTIGFTNDISGASCGSLEAADVFYVFTPSAPGRVQVTTCNPGTGYDSKLAVFRDNLGNCIAYNDDNCGNYFIFASTLEFDACPGTTYYIVVDGFGGATGPYEMSLTQLYPISCGYFPGIYGSTGTVGGTIIGIDPTTGAGTGLFPHGSLGPVTEIQSDPTGTFLYGSTGQGTAHLITIDPLTGLETLVGTHPYGAINGLEFVGDVLYGTFIPFAQGQSTLVQVDPTTAALTPVGPTGRGPIAGLAYDRVNGVMYGISAENTLPAQLLTIDLNTGLATVVGPIGVALQCRGLVFDRNGILYTGTSTTNQLPGFLISVNKTTGAGTIIGPTGFSGISGLAILQMQPVPVSNWALWIGLLLIVGFTIFRFRRIS